LRVEKLRFSVDSALLSELGEKLVESVHLALLELVKNAYDADATHVTVRMVSTPTGCVRTDTGRMHWCAEIRSACWNPISGNAWK
jgi:hypothetical protein